MTTGVMVTPPFSNIRTEAEDTADVVNDIDDDSLFSTFSMVAEELLLLLPCPLIRLPPDDPFPVCWPLLLLPAVSLLLRDSMVMACSLLS